MSQLERVGEILAEIAAIRHLDEAWALPCERAQRASVSLDEGRTWNPTDAHCGGQNPAEWVLRSACPCEPSVFLYCTPCRDVVLNLPRVACIGCGQIWTPPSKSFRLIEPLNRRPQ